MPKTISVKALKQDAVKDVDLALDRYDNVPKPAKGDDNAYWFKAWVAQMTVVELNAIRESYCEERLVAALNNFSQHFLTTNRAKGIRRIPAGLAGYIVRGGRSYLDFRSSGDLLKKSDDLLTKSKNPFDPLRKDHKYIDLLSAVRNRVVHYSHASWVKYKQALREVYDIHSAPETQEFLQALDKRMVSRARRKSRLHGIAKKLIEAINKT